MRRVAAAAVVLGAALVLGACAPVTDAAWEPPSWAEEEIAVARPPAALDLAAQTALAASVTSYRLHNAAVGVEARFALLPGTGGGVDAFNAVIGDLVRDAVATQSAASGVAYAPATGAGLADRACITGSTAWTADEILAEVGASGSAVVCDIVAAAGPFFGERVRVVAGGPDAPRSDATTTFYADTATGEVVTAAQLWADDAAARLSADVVDALRRDAGALTLAPAEAGDDAQLAAIEAALSTTVPAGDGGLVFTIAAGFEAPALRALGVDATVEPLTIGVPAAIVADLVTPFGARLLGSAGEPYTGPSGPAGFDRVDCTLVPCIALTYDDGPSSLTPTLLDVLAEARVAASFYMLGPSAASREDTVRRVASEGHLIGNHTWSHPQLPELDDEQVAAQIVRTRDLLRAISGQAVASFRPPYGEYDQRVLDVAQQPAILWSVDTRDWAGPADDVLEATAVDGASPGGIILFHDIHERSVRVAPAVVAGLLDRGFSLVTVSQLFGGTLPASGAWSRAG